MAVRIWSFNFRDIALDPKLGLKDYSLLYSNGIEIRKLLKDENVEYGIKSGRTPSRFEEDYWNGEHDFLTMQDIDTLTFRLNPTCTDKITDYAIEQERTLFRCPANGLLISNAMTVGLSVLTDRPVYINQNIFYLNLNEEKVNRKFLMWYFNSVLRPAFQRTFYAKYLSKDELSRIKIPSYPLHFQNKIVERIEPIEREIRRLQGTISDPAEAISRVFARELGFDLAKFEELKRQKMFFVGLRDFANNHDLRCSVKFHREAAKFVESELRSRTDKSVKDFLAEDIVLGASVSPDNYDDNGEFYYVAMSSIKNWNFDKESARSVSDEYAKKNQAKSVKEADIIMARSGEGTIGKVALIGDDVSGIFADFTMRIRLKDYDPEFAYYYFRTRYVQYLIETHKKGLGNNTNIFPNQIREFPMLDIPSSRQKRIVREIRTEFSAQDKIKRGIEAKRKEIDRIIEQALMKNERTTTNRRFN